MSYNTDLQTNNVNLQAILDTVNNLPEAGSGGASVETCTVNVDVPSGLIIYALSYTTTDSSGEIEHVVLTPNSANAQNLKCVCGSHINVFSNASGINSNIVVNGSITSELLVYTREYYSIVQVSNIQNCTMHVSVNSSAGGSFD